MSERYKLKIKDEREVEEGVPFWRLNTFTFFEFMSSKVLYLKISDILAIEFAQGSQFNFVRLAQFCENDIRRVKPVNVVVDLRIVDEIESEE